MAHLTRRDFLIDSGFLTGGTISMLALGGDAFAPSLLQAGEIRFIQKSCATTNGAKGNVLVAYASMHGSTGGVAEAIGNALCEDGWRADIRLAGQVTEVTPYDAVVVGSAIKTSQWLSEAVEFVKTHERQLQKVPVAYFLTCLTLATCRPQAKKQAASFFDPVHEAAPSVKPLQSGLFAGELDYGKMAMFKRMIMKQKMKKTGVKEGDYRDWSAIQRWASDFSALADRQSRATGRQFG